MNIYKIDRNDLTSAALPMGKAGQPNAECVTRASFKWIAIFRFMKKMTVAILCLWLLVVSLAESNAQQTLVVRIRNGGSRPIYIGVYDHVCDVAFDRRLGGLNTVLVRVCLDSRGRGKITISDRFGWNEEFELGVGRTSINLGLRRQGR
jgi:hypothetical protein